ncbi:MAG: hypothetical protein EAZ42_03610 [Verrucomicrobia bacterium]|nr:MAG: hypothetical protein EAZ42_03610 [Verrucomicrobiota bacterium]
MGWVLYADSIDMIFDRKSVNGFNRFATHYVSLPTRIDVRCTLLSPSVLEEIFQNCSSGLHG